jgi:hypothetical protein
MIGMPAQSAERQNLYAVNLGRSSVYATQLVVGRFRYECQSGEKRSLRCVRQVLAETV